MVGQLFSDYVSWSSEFPGGVSESMRKKMSGRLKLTEHCVSDFLLRIRAVLLLSVNLLHIIKISCRISIYKQVPPKI